MILTTTYMIVQEAKCGYEGLELLGLYINSRTSSLFSTHNLDWVHVTWVYMPPREESSNSVTYMYMPFVGSGLSVPVIWFYDHSLYKVEIWHYTRIALSLI